MPNRAHTRFATVLLSVLLAASAHAQVTTGGKSGGLPGGGPGGPRNQPPTTGTKSPDPGFARHVLNRLTYGGNRRDWARIREVGVEAFIEEQLAPERLSEDPILFQKLADHPPSRNDLGQSTAQWQWLFSEYLTRAMYSKRQLLEQMTEFWENHFSDEFWLYTSSGSGGSAPLLFDATGAALVASYHGHAFPGTDGGPFSYYREPSLNVRSPSGWSNAVGLNLYDPPSGLYLAAVVHPLNGDVVTTVFNERDLDLVVTFLDSTMNLYSRVTVDAGGDVGRWPSVAINSIGTICVAYYDASNQDLRLARRPDGGNWSLETVAAIGDVGRHATIAIAPDGQPAIAYYDASNQDLRYTRWNGTAWIDELVDGVGRVGSWASLAFDSSGRARISYFDQDNADLKLATRGATWLLPVAVDSVGEVGEYTSLAIAPSGEPAISYYDRTNHDLKYAESQGLGFRIDTVVPGPALSGQWTTLKFHPTTGLPAISHQGNLAVEYAEYDGTTWLNERVSPISGTGQSEWEEAEITAFRANALGRFRDLLGASAHSPGMAYYLNNDVNVVANGNENYARELLELHTVGVDGGYQQQDVEQAALALTGWGTTKTTQRSSCELTLGDFCYNHEGHDGRALSIMGFTLPDDSVKTPANYMRQGELLLDYLAGHPATARFICTKLARKFVDDRPSERLIGDCASTFLSSGGDIRQVMRSLMFSREFADPATFAGKVRTPLEYVLAIMRNLEGNFGGPDLYHEITRLEFKPFLITTPTGYPEVGSEWISPGLHLRRWVLADRVLHNGNAGIKVDPHALILEAGLSAAPAIIEWFADVLYGGDLEPLERAEYLDCLDTPTPFDLTSPTADARLRDLVGVMLGSPRFLKQ